MLGEIGKLSFVPHLISSIISVFFINCTKLEENRNSSLFPRIDFFLSSIGNNPSRIIFFLAGYILYF